MPNPQLSGNSTRPSAQVQRGPLPGNPPHLQFLPGNALLDSRPQRLGCRLLGGKTSSKTLRRRGSGAAIRDLLLCEHPLQKPLAEALDRLRDPRHFDDVDSRSHQHDATVAHAKIFRARPRPTGVKRFSAPSDGASVCDLCLPDSIIKGWDLNLTALCADETPRTVRFLSGAVMACGGYVLSRRFDTAGSAAIEFEFVRATCVEMYSVMIAAGLDLSAQSHLAMSALCQCTRETLEATAGDPVRVELTIRKAATSLTEPGGPAAPPRVA
jgi:hypothetical protein